MMDHSRNNIYFVVVVLALFLSPFSHGNVIQEQQQAAENARVILTNSLSSTTVSTAIDCDICYVILGIIASFTSINSTEAEISAIVANVCDYVEQSYKSFCIDMIETFGPMIIELLVQREPPLFICSAIGFCNETNSHLCTEAFAPLSIPRPSITEECAICNWLTNSLQRFISPNTTSDSVQRFMSKVCFVPKARYTTKCQQTVVVFGDKMVEDIKKGSNPATVCSQIHLC